MYKPNGLAKNIYCYDVNSLYPFVMSNNPFPIGLINQFEAILDDVYWIGDVDISTKKDMYIPPIQLHYNLSNKSGGVRTISPNGSFNMKINSVEYNSYKDYYDFNINSGYFWKTDFIFKDYVNTLYEMSLNLILLISLLSY